MRHLAFSLTLAAAMTASAVTSTVALARSAADNALLKEISRHFSSVPTMKGEFIQFGPKGRQTQGTFKLARPGRIRFDYAAPATLTVKADGRTVEVHNKKLRTSDYLPLSKTPLKLLLAKRINVKDRAIRSVKRDNDIVTVNLADKSMFGAAKIALMFDAKTYDLKQWTITDNQGKDTSVMIFNVQKNVRLSKRDFRVSKRSKRFQDSGR